MLGSFAATADDIAARFGLRKYPRSWRGRCPACEYAGNIFSVRAGRKQRVLLYCANGCDRDILAEAVALRVGQPAKPEPKPHPNDDEERRRKQERAAALWRSSGPARGTVAETYLRARGLPDLSTSAALRFRGDCPHPEGGKLPAMVALVTDSAGAPSAVHRTYLRRDGSGKADVEPAKASLGSVWGCAIRLHAAGPEMAIAEGIETAASAGALLGVPAWAAISAGNLARAMILPATVRSVLVAVDRDPAGERAADDAARRWRAEGRRVRLMVPDLGGQDANDVLLARVARHG